MPLSSAITSQPSAPGSSDSGMRKLMRQLGSSAASGAAVVGNTLNKPSRALWGTLDQLAGGHGGGGLLNLIPFSDTMGLTDPGQGVEASQFLANRGLLAQNDPTKWEAMDFGRGLIDAVGDPLGWVAPLGLTKAGVAASRAGTATKGILPSIARGERAILGLQMPFGTKPLASLGTGKAVADKLQSVGQTAMKVPGAKTVASGLDYARRLGRSQFDARVAGSVLPEAQQHFEKLTRSRKEAVAGVETRLGTVAQVLTDAGLTSRADGDRLRHFLETGDRSLLSHPAEIEVVEDLMKIRDDMLDMQQKGGLASTRLDDVLANGDSLGYFPRQTPRSGAKKSQGFSTVGPNAAGSRSSARRNTLFRGAYTKTFNDVVADKDIADLISDGRAKRIKREDLIDAVANTINSKYGGDIVQNGDVFTRNGKPVWKRDPKTKAILLDAAGNKIQQTIDRHRELAQAMVGKSGDKWRGRGGVFVNHPVQDALRMFGSRADRSPIGSHLAETLATTAGAGRGGGARVVDIVKNLNRGRVGLNPDAIVDMIHQHRTGTTLDAAYGAGSKARAKAKSGLLLETVDDNLARELTKPWDAYKSPSAIEPIGKAVDSFTALLKAGLLSFPGRITRDFTSGLARMLEQGWLTNGSIGEASKLLRGQAVEGLERVPAIRKTLDDMKLAPTAENAVRAYKAMYQARHGRSGLHSSGSQLSGGLEDIVGAIPGQTPQSYGGLFGESGSLAIGRDPASGSFEAERFNPFNIAGVGDRTETKFGPAASANLLGGHVDSLTRMASDLELIRRGYDPHEAAKEVKGAFADYSSDALTATEQQIRRLIPFYNFSKSQAAHVGKELLMNPGGRMSQTVRATARSQDNDPFLPEHIAQTTAIPLGQADDGTKRFISGLGLMHEDPLAFLGGGVQGALTEGLSRSHPFVKGPIEWATGESLFQRGPMGGRDLGDMDPTIGRLLSNLGESTGLMEPGGGPVRFPGQTPVEFIVGNSPFSRAVSTARSAFDPRKGLGTKAANILTGARVSDVSAKSQDAVLRDAAAKLGKEIGAKEFSSIRFKKEDLAQLQQVDPAAAEMAMAFNELQNQLAGRVKARKGTVAKRGIKPKKPESLR